MARPRPGSGQPLPVHSVEPPSIFDLVGITFKLDPALLAAIASVESGGRTRAISPKGASGLMQLMPDTARRFGVNDTFNPVENLVGAARFLAYLRQYAEIEDLPELLAAYNAGEGAVKHYRGIPPYEETHEYVRRVLLTYLLENGPLPAPAAGAGPGFPGPGARLSRVPAPPARMPLWRPRASQAGAYIAAGPTTDADVLAGLAQIRNARSNALKRQLELK